MEKNKISTYFLYAIGEILLVVIGILIALQVNNWNEDRSLRAQERVYLQLLREDLILQKAENETQRSAILNHISNLEPLHEFMSNKFQVTGSEKDEVKSMLSIIPVGRTLGAYEATFLDMTSSGNISLISDPDLKNQIIQHYQIQKRDRDVINNNTNQTFKDLWVSMIERNLIVTPENLGAHVLDDEKIEFETSFDFLDDELFENISRDENIILIKNVLGWKVTSTKIALRFMQQSDERIDNLIAEIDTELSR